MDLTRATWTDVADLASETDLAVLPVGSTEQHGPHAPLGTDALLAEAVAAEGVARFDGAVVRAPAIPIGVAEEHRHFPGTMWLSEDTFRAVVRDAVASLAYHGFDRVVLVNGHGGNVGALREVAGTITRRDDAYAVPFTWFEAVDLEAVNENADERNEGDRRDGENESDPLRMGHGGPLETALLRHLFADLVREDRIDAAREGAAPRWGEWVSYANLAYDSAEFTENGVVGDPAAGTAALGEQLFDRAATALVALLEAVEARDASRPNRR